MKFIVINTSLYIQQSVKRLTKPLFYGIIKKINKGVIRMSQSIEAQLNVIPVADAIAQYRQQFPDDILVKVQLEYEGPFLKYEFVGNDGTHRHVYEFNATTGAQLKNNSKPLKTKHQDPARREAASLNTENVLTIDQATELALEQVEVTRPFQWELDRKGDRTIWKIEIANETGDLIYEVKLDAQDGTITQVKLKD